MNGEAVCSPGRVTHPMVAVSGCGAGGRQRASFGQAHGSHGQTLASFTLNWALERMELHAPGQQERLEEGGASVRIGVLCDLPHSQSCCHDSGRKPAPAFGSHRGSSAPCLWGGGCSQPLQARVLNPNFVSRAPSLCSSPHDPHLLRPLLVPTSHRFNPKS